MPTPFATSGKYLIENEKKIMLTTGIYLDGKEREYTFENELYEYIEKYQRSIGGSDTEGLMCYNFCLNTNPYELQPSGAMNLSKFTKIELQVTTIEPPLDSNLQFNSICTSDSDTVIGTTKASSSIYLYTFDIHFMEERFNIVKFMSGNVGLMYAR